MEKAKVSRRKFLGVSTAGAVGALVGGLVIGGVAGYFGGQAGAAPTTITKTVTGAAVTTTVTAAPTTVTKTVAAEPTKPPRTIKIGTTIPMTGPAAPVKMAEPKLYDAVKKMINEEYGGIWVEEYKQRLPVEFIWYDDKTDIPTCVKYYEKLIVEDKVDLLIGSFGALLSTAAAAVAERHATPYIDAQAAEIPVIAGKEWITFNQDFVYTWLFNYIDMIKADGRPKTLAFINDTSVFGKETTWYGDDYARKKGLDVVLHEEYDPATVDYSPLIVKLRSANPDILVNCDQVGICQATFWNQAWDAGYRPKDYHPLYGQFAIFWKTVGPERANWITGDPELYRTLKYEGVWGKKGYWDRVWKAGCKWEEYPLSVVVYICLEIAAKGIETAGTLDKEKLNKALHTMIISTIWGEWEPKVKTVDGKVCKGVPNLRHLPMQNQNGEIVILWPPDVKTGDYVYPAPWGTGRHELKY